MQFVYPNCKLPRDDRILRDIHSSANKLYSKLLTVDLDSIGLSEYIKHYFKIKLRDMEHNLQLASYTLCWSLAGSNKPYNEFHFIEYGAGSGLTCLLAKELGLIVTYNDIYDISVNDAKLIAQAVLNPADHYIQGDISEILSYLESSDIVCDSIASSDVIEHIYDIQDFFQKLSLLPGETVSVVMSSGANPYHPYIRRKLMKKQVELENLDRTKEFGHKERDTLKAYKVARKQLISDYLSKSKTNLEEGDFKKLVDNTRGLSKEDIIKTVDKYLTTEKFPTPLTHPTNTCDPYTGNWAEHLMNPYDLSSMLEEQAFNAVVIPGFYGNSSNRLRRYTGKSLDLLINSDLLGKNALTLAPFYTIYGRKRQ